MPIVFSKDVLFSHVPKAGGTSVSRYLLENLPPPVFYVSPGHLGLDQCEGLTHIPGRQHKPLWMIRDLVREHGFELEDFSLILAVVRNPYDITVSNYAYQQRTVAPFELIEAGAATPRPAAPLSALRQTLATMLDALTPGKVARIERERGISVAAIREAILRVATDLGRQVDIWHDASFFYIGLAVEAAESRDRSVYDLATTREFREFLLDEQRTSPNPWLARLYDFYHLDGVVPPNMRILRFEALGDELTAALREVGLAFAAELPWLNKSDHGPYASYYDAETEAIVYEQARWLFDEGYYERLPVARVRT